MPHLSFYPVAASYLLVGGCALVLLGLLLVGPGGEKTSRRRRGALVGIRLAVVVLVIAAMLRPTLVYTKTEKQAATVVVLVDRSRSMTVPDEAGGKTRWEALRQALDDARGALAKLAGDFEVLAYRFDEESHPVEFAEGEIRLEENPDGGQTAIGAALDDVVRQQTGKRLLGIVLLSDGAQRAYPPRDLLPQTAAARLKPLGVPLYAIRFGKSRGLGQAQDVAVKDLLVNQTVYVKNELAVAGQIRVDGYTGRKIPVELLVETAPGEMEAVAREDFEAAADGELVPVRFTHVPQLPGEYKISLEAISQPGELVTTNNRLSTFVNVLKGGLNVLYLESFPPRPEQKYLRWSWSASKDINVRTVHINPRQPETGRPDLSEQFKPGRFEVYVLGDLHSSVFREGELEALQEAVSRGAGLLMLGGFHSFGPGGYADTPLAAVLPVKMNRFEAQRLDDEISRDLHLAGPLKMTPTEIGALRFPMMLAATPRENRAAWAQLPPLGGANRFRPEAVKAGAETLAEAGPDQPLLVAHAYGNGRVMAFAADTTCHWWMRGHEAAHKRFWRQVILWLARKDESIEGTVRIELAQRRFGPGDRVEFGVEARNPSGSPVEEAEYEAVVVLPDGAEQRVDLIHGAGKVTGSFRATQRAGDYAIRASATKDGKLLGSARTRFLVFEQDLELDNAAADATVLESLAAMSGGRTLSPEELSDLILRMTEDTESLEVRTETKKTLWDTWGFLLLVVGLLGAEWYLRKRWGLV